MGALGTRQKRGSRAGSKSLLHLHDHLLLPKQVHAGSAMPCAERVPPEQRSRSDREGMQEHTHLPWLRGRLSLPLALLTQRAGAATANAGGVDHTQAPIGFPTPLVCRQLLRCGTAQGAIGLQGKVATREATGFPGQSDFGGSIPLHRGSHVGSRSLPSQVSRGKRGGAHRIWEQVMAQFQPQIPDPLSNDLPALLTTGSMAAPTVRFAASISSSESAVSKAPRCETRALL